MDNSHHRPLEDRFPHVPLPGEREPDTLVGTQAGAVSGVGFGADVPPVDLEATMDGATVVEHLKEGGGRDYEKTREKEAGD